MRGGQVGLVTSHPIWQLHICVYHRSIRKFRKSEMGGANPLRRDKPADLQERRIKRDRLWRLDGAAFRRFNRRRAVSPLHQVASKDSPARGRNDFRRAAARLERDQEAAQKVPGGRFLFVSHGDVIRAILSHYMKLPLNEYRRLRVDNGSLSALQTDRRWAEIKYVNYLTEIILASKEPYMAAKAAALRK